MKKLGQLLLNFGWIDESQLQEALQTQSVVGGRIGSCLLEVGALGEAMLLRALAHQLSVPAARSIDLKSIPEEVHSILAPRVALRCLAVPFRMLGSELYVALLDVSNLDLLDEISFATGKQVRAHVGNEVRIFSALHQYYGRDQSERFQLLEAHLDRPSHAAPRRSGFGQHLERINEETSGNVPVLRGSSSHEVAGPGTVTKDFSPSRTSLRSSPPSRQERTPAASRSPSPKTTAPFLRRFGSLDEFATALENMDDREAMARIFVEFISSHFRRVLLYKVLPEMVVGWIGSGRGVNHQRLEASLVEIDKPSIFHDLHNGRTAHHGPLASIAAHVDIFAAFGQDQLSACASFPIRLGHRLVSVVVAEPKVGHPPEEFEEEVAGACEVLGAAFGKYILRQREAGSRPR